MGVESEWLGWGRVGWVEIDLAAVVIVSGRSAGCCWVGWGWNLGRDRTRDRWCRVDDRVGGCDDLVLVLVRLRCILMRVEGSVVGLYALIG